MIINTSSWHYKIYNYTYGLGEPPKQTNLCQYVRRLALAPFILTVFGLISIFVATLVVCIFIMAPLVGYLPTSLNPIKIYDYETPLEKYQGLPVGKGYWSFQLYPWHVILVGLFIAGNVAMVHHFGWHSVVIECQVFGYLIGLPALVFGIVWWYVHHDDFEFETGRLISAYLSAKKQKVCPVVKFQSSKQENDTCS
jgi:hypothetical protein